MDVPRLVHQLSDLYTLLGALAVVVGISLIMWKLYRSDDTTDSPLDE